MELVVRYDNGALLRRVRNKERVLGALMMVPTALSIGLAVLVWYLANNLMFVVIFIMLGLITLFVALGSITGRFTPRYAKAEAPDGVAWVLDREGVTVNMPGGEAKIPWAEVVIRQANAGGLTAIRVGSDEVSTAYVEQHLSHSLAEIEDAARDLRRRRRRR